MKSMKALGAAGALVVAAIVGGTLMSSALAAPSPSPGLAADAAHRAGGEHCATYRAALADELGVTPDALAAARRAAATTTVDAAVAAGDLTEERGEALKERIAESDGAGCGWWLRHHRGPGPLRQHLPLGELLTTAAASLGIEEGDLVERLRAGDTLADVATAEGVEITVVTDAVTTALDAALDEAVAAGDLTRERADEIAARAADALADGEWPRHRGPWAEDAPTT